MRGLTQSAAEDEDADLLSGRTSSSHYSAHEDHRIANTESQFTERQPCCTRLGKKLSEPGVLVCISHLFSYWGDRMWGFAVGLYLVEITPNSLRLTAIYGLVRTLSVVVFGPAVGEWVDITPRLKAIRLSLICQNVLVCLCALVVLVHLRVDIQQPNRELLYNIIRAIIIILGALAFLVGRGSQIAIERDWVVVITNGDKDKLAVLNTNLRRIDLTCAILGPAAVGFIMSLVSKYAGIIFICSWNVASFFIEYYLLRHVYKSVPALAVKKRKEDGLLEENKRGMEMHKEDDANEELDIEIKDGKKQPGKIRSLALWTRAKAFLRGWLVYSRQSVALAGVSLAMLYLTFLGFSSITTGYAYTQRLSEGVISICYALASLVGILGTALFPPLRRRVGLPRTGFFSFMLQLSMLALCVLSIWLPGSPYYARYRRPTNTAVATPSASSILSLVSSYDVRTTNNIARLSTKPVDMPLQTPILKTVPSVAMSLKESTFRPSHLVSSVHKTDIPLLNTVVVLPSCTSKKCSRIGIRPSTTIYRMLVNSSTVNNGTRNNSVKPLAFSYWSISVLVTGLILSRAGLWMTDLTVTQLLQENVAEQERGIVGGTQQAFNSILDLSHYVITIFIPDPANFWILILISYSAILTGYLIYIIFYFRFTRKMKENVSSEEEVKE